MWRITVFSEGKCSNMYEFETENEAREALKNIQGYKILTEMVYLETCSSLVAI
ncbi:hypothetical protein [Bacillus sp. 1NLA3E]|uniref:hypothetical protein n=1 Tax=Bacillus sp. 1NLA3E TaxID=666686 RepID=UPI000247EE1F|nr:hypothetical protein [Bacillus sp. 1NLA3E]